jgi:uncharacterized protein YbjT (DUF2867 family)
MPSLITVIGATGTVGRELVGRLIAAGHRVRAVTREPDKAAALFGQAVEVVAADLGQAETLTAAFANAERAFVLANGLGIALEEVAVAAARKAGVAHIVKVSAQQVEFPEVANAPLGRAHLHSEEVLRESGTAWTILRPSYFSSNLALPFIFNRLEGKIVLPAGNGRETPIDPRDIAAVAAKVLTTPGHAGKTYVLTGPELLSQSEMMARASAILKRPLAYVDEDEQMARSRYLAVGIPPGFAESLLGHFAAIRAGRAYVTTTVADIAGRPAHPFDDWVRDNAAALKA